MNNKILLILILAGSFSTNFGRAVEANTNREQFSQLLLPILQTIKSGLSFSYSSRAVTYAADGSTESDTTQIYKVSLQEKLFSISLHDPSQTDALHQHMLRAFDGNRFQMLYGNELLVLSRDKKAFRVVDVFSGPLTAPLISLFDSPGVVLGENAFDERRINKLLSESSITINSQGRISCKITTAGIDDNSEKYYELIFDKLSPFPTFWEMKSAKGYSTTGIVEKTHLIPHANIFVPEIVKITDYTGDRKVSETVIQLNTSSFKLGPLPGNRYTIPSTAAKTVRDMDLDIDLKTPENNFSR